MKEEEESEEKKKDADGKKKKGRPKSTHRIRDYGINYLAFLLTQILGNGVTSLDTMMGLFGLGVHSGSHREWTFIAAELGTAEQKRADKIQYTNLLIEIEATRAKQAAMVAASKNNATTDIFSYPNYPPFTDALPTTTEPAMEPQDNVLSPCTALPTVSTENNNTNITDVATLSAATYLLPLPSTNHVPTTDTTFATISNTMQPTENNNNNAATIATLLETYLLTLPTMNPVPTTDDTFASITTAMEPAVEQHDGTTSMTYLLPLPTMNQPLPMDNMFASITAMMESAVEQQDNAMSQNDALSKDTRENDNDNAITITTRPAAMYGLPLSTMNPVETNDNTMSSVTTMLGPAVEQHDGTTSNNISLSIDTTNNNNTNVAAIASLPNAEIVAENAAHLPDSAIAAAETHSAVLHTKFNILIRNEKTKGEYAMFVLETAGYTEEENLIGFVKKYLEPLTVCYDMGWQRRSSGSAYNSMSGHAFLVGANSNKILKRIVFSKSCATCSRREKKKKNNDSLPKESEPNGVRETKVMDHRCPWNFKGSSKSMEPHGAVALIRDLYDTGIAFGAELVVDDDCSTKANTRHSFQDLINEKIWANKATCWPKKNKKYADDHGKLPLRVPAIQRYLADPMHRCKSFGRDLFKFVEQKGKELGFDKIDCARLKRNFTYWLRQNCNEPFHIFVHRFACVLEHHFGIHDFCKGKKEGGWCKYKDDEEMMKKAMEENRYHDKQMEADLYDAVRTIWCKYATEDMLRQSHHPYWCQKSESLNQLVTVFAPKDKHLSASMSLSDRIALVVIVDSVGFAQGVMEIMEEIGCTVPISTIECLK